ncbi:amidohydrolase family protein [Streptomyces mirabilis]|uniref:amidohydrolase family protein n=1 Tax=Streptomyces mirabilis TaxID=68239 RepID=UPI003668D47A
MTGLIDVHAHLLFDELLGHAGDIGPRLEHDTAGNATLVTGGYSFGIGKSATTNRNARQRLDALDEADITVQVVSGSPLWYFPHHDAETVRPFARRYNDLMAEWTQNAPDRLKALAVLPVQDTAASVSELERAVGELGFLGACIGTDARSDLDDPGLDDLYSACEQLDVPLFIHSVVAGVDGPPGDARLRRWLRDVTIGYPFEETVAVTSLVLGGVLERHPRLDICLSHGGGAIPFLLGRVRDWVATGTAPIDVEQFDRDYARLWFDTHLHSALSTQLLTQVASPDRLVFGTNFGGWDSAASHEADDTPIDLSANARRLLRLPESDLPV